MYEFTKYFLAAYFTGVALFYLWRLKIRPTPRQFMGTIGSRHWIGHAVFRFFRLLILSVCVLRIPFDQIDSALLVCGYLQQPWLMALGMALLIGGFALTLIGHFALGNQWRSGIDENQAQSIITSGIYHYSRNPMFLGVLITQWGFFAALPSIFTFACLVIGHVAIFNQLKLEETHLHENGGRSYQDYYHSVSRWWSIKLS